MFPHFRFRVFSLRPGKVGGQASVTRNLNFSVERQPRSRASKNPAGLGAAPRPTRPFLYILGPWLKSEAPALQAVLSGKRLPRRTSTNCEGRRKNGRMKKWRILHSAFNVLHSFVRGENSTNAQRGAS